MKDLVRAAGGLLLLAMHMPALAQVSWGEEYAKRLKSAQTTAPLGDSLFGDEISLFTGSVKFSATDVSLPGNNALPVAFSRRLDFSDQTASKLLGRWDLDVPRLSGIYPLGSPWTPAATRCSTPGEPPPVSGFVAQEYWSGNELHLPGGGSFVMLGIHANPKRKLPQDGAVYRWVTKNNWYFSCLSTLQSGQPGQGFLAISPDGVRYHFDWMTTQPYPGIQHQSHVGPGMTQLMRERVNLYPTLVQDRFGNKVEYDWVGNELRSISSNDERLITITYVSGKVDTVTAGTRSWHYGYSANRYDLVTVTNPDTSQWQYDFIDVKPWIKYDESVDSNGRYINGGGNLCSPMRRMFPLTATAVVTHPSGAVGEFTFTQTRHGRTHVPYDCMQLEDRGPRWNLYSMFQDVQSITSKRITGLGLGDMLWTYAYTGLEGEYSTRPEGTQPTPPPHYKYVTVTQPDQSSVVHTFGKDYELNEGQLVTLQTRNAQGVLARIESNTYVSASEAAAAPFLASMGLTYVAYADGFSSTAIRPQKTRQITQNGVTFSSTVNAFDILARPSTVTKSSTPLGYSKIDTTVYYDDFPKWVLGQVATVTCMTALPESTSCNGNDEVQKTEYDANAMPWRTYAFGKRQQTLTYDTTSAVTTGQRGTLKTVTDGNNNVITLTGWKRGIPQQIQHPATPDHPVVYQKAGVSDNGEIDWVTDENNYKTCYTYDPMGRLASITYPSEAPSVYGVCDTSTWAATTRSFLPYTAGPKYGIPAGHWQQTVSTGNARKITYYDALWRPLVEETYDNANAANTRSVSVKRYDSSGRLAFQSYPSRTAIDFDDPAVKGIKTEYDALDRVTAVRQDAEGGAVLSTTTVYTPNRLKTEVTNPNGKTTYTWYQAYDQPHYDWPIQIYHPESVGTDIVRDALGKPLTVTRRSLVDNTISATRSYAYNIHHELCRTVEPETGTTAMGYDGAGNLAWSAAGLPAVSETTPCANGTESDVVARKVSRTYDARNRLKTLRFPDTRGNQDWFYTPDGLPSKVVTVNVPGAVHPENLYTYNKRRLPVTELQALPAWYTFSLSYGYDGNGHLKTLHYPSGLGIDFMPNALGQATEARRIADGHKYAYGASYHPNGAIERFVYGNGIAHTMTPNERQLPRFVVDAGVFDLDYRYDGNGNVDMVVDNLRLASGHRYLDYDGLDRLTHVGFAQLGGNHHMHFTYDALDNLKTWKHPTADGAGMVRDHLYCYNSKNQLEFIRSGATACSGSGAGSAAEHFQYDLQGNVEIHDVGFDFDYGNRLREVIDVERYRYDAHGRRILAMNFATGTVFSQYGGNGQLLYQKNERTGQNKEIDHIYLAGSLIVQRDSAVGNLYYHTDALGSPVAVTNQSGGLVENIVDYEPYGRQLDTAATIGKDRPGYTGHVRDVATGLNYMQQRYYDPAIGRFLSVDPVTANSGTGANFNRYWYANNNPYRFTDPDGREVFDCRGKSSCASEIKVADLKKGDVVKTDGATVKVGKSSLTVSFSKGFGNGSSAANTGPRLVPQGPAGANVDANMREARFLGPVGFRDQVKNKGPWDYKQQGREYEPFGNFNYGATGRGHGFRPEILLQEAGIAQRSAGTSLPEWGSPGLRFYPHTGTGSFGDDPVDQFWIQQGIRYADEK